MHAVAGDLRGTLLDYRKRHQAGHAGARNPCADCPPQAAALGPACYSGLSGAIGAGREKPRRRPFARLTRGGPATLPPYAIPVSVWRGRIGRTPVRSVVKRQAAPSPWTSSGAGAACINAETCPSVRVAACINAAPAPLFAAQPASTQCQTHCSRRSRLKFFAEAFFQKGWSAANESFLPSFFQKGRRGL